MAQSNEPIVTRPRLLLNNSAAEFVETQVDKYLGPAFAMPNGSEFSPDLDMFINREDAASLKIENFFEASKQKAKEFESLLIRLTESINEQQPGNRHVVKSKRPDAYEMEDVMEIAEKIYTKHQHTSTVRNCTSIFRKCFNAVGRNQGAFANLLGFIPNDSYGSIVCGGFTLILTAIERADKLRENIYTALAEIPRKLELISGFTDCHRKSINIYRAGDSVLVALFEVMELIITELTKSKGKKAIAMLIQGKSYGSGIDNALASLEHKLKDFMSQVSLCMSRKLGEVGASQFRIEEGQSRAEHMLVYLSKVANQLETAQASAATLQSAAIITTERQDTIKQIQLEVTEMEAKINIMTKMYRLIASHPLFDPHGGGYVLEAVQRLPKTSPKIHNQKLAEDWEEALPLQFHALATEDLDESLGRSSPLDIDDQSKVQYIMSSPSLLEWLNSKEAKTLLVQSEAAPQDLVNPLSFSSAFLARTICDAYKSPVLYYNCGLRSFQSLDEENSGPIALINTLSVQLIHHLLTWHGDIADMSCLQRSPSFSPPKKSYRRDLKHGRNLFKRLLNQLPKPSLVFIVIDGLSRITGEDKYVNKILQDFLYLAACSRIKLLLTDILSRTVLEGYEYLEVFVHDGIDVGGQPLNLQFLTQETRDSLPLDNTANNS